MSYHVDHDGSEMLKKLSQVPQGVHFFISHVPPFNVMDLAWVDTPDHRICGVCNKAHAKFRHWGSKAILQTVLKLQPKVKCVNNNDNCFVFAANMGSKNKTIIIIVHPVRFISLVMCMTQQEWLGWKDARPLLSMQLWILILSHTLSMFTYE